MKEKKNTKLYKFISIFSKILFGVTLLILAILVSCVFKTNIFPIKYLIIFIGLVLIIAVVFGILLLRKNDIWFKLVISFMALLICFASATAIAYLNNTHDFIKNLISKEYEGINYNVIVLKESIYDEVEDLDSFTIGFLNESSIEVIESLGKTISFNDSVTNNISSLVNGLYDGTYNAIVIDDEILNMLKEENDFQGFEEKIKVIYNFNVDMKVSSEEVPTIKVSEEPFIMYISGIDQYGKVTTVRGRSDVNMLVMVNPKTHKVLLLNTPRDYYVNLHGKNGLRDKLTHAGVYGIDLSIKTLEDLYNIDINYYLRVNFDTVISLVDVIGGIDVYSDKSFRCFTNRSVYVDEGINHFDGKSALAFSRERYAYLTGDRHRGQNQQAVISAIIKKTASSKVLLTKYNNILDTLNGSFQTNMPTDMITDFIKYQLNEMPSWNVESISVSGSDASMPTYSYGENQKLYVMIPYENDVNNAKNRIREMLNEK